MRLFSNMMFWAHMSSPEATFKCFDGEIPTTPPPLHKCGTKLASLLCQLSTAFT